MVGDYTHPDDLKRDLVTVARVIVHEKLVLSLLYKKSSHKTFEKNFSTWTDIFRGRGQCFGEKKWNRRRKDLTKFKKASNDKQFPATKIILKWNKFSLKMRKIKSQAKFKRRLKQYLLIKFKLIPFERKISNIRSYFNGCPFFIPILITLYILTFDFLTPMSFNPEKISPLLVSSVFSAFYN